MKHFKLAIVLLIIGILLVVTGNSLLVYKLLNNEKIEEEKIIRNIKTEYKVFKEDVQLFSKVKEEYDSKVSSNLFLETIDEYPNWIKNIDSYTKIINKLDKDSKYLKNNCINKSHIDKGTLNKCSAFMLAYEECVNTYVNDIEDFNNKIVEFSKNYDKVKLTEYKLKFDRVDINNDGEYTVIE